MHLDDIAWHTIITTNHPHVLQQLGFCGARQVSSHYSWWKQCGILFLQRDQNISNRKHVFFSNNIRNNYNRQYCFLSIVGSFIWVLIILHFFSHTFLDSDHLKCLKVSIFFGFLCSV